MGEVAPGLKVPKITPGKTKEAWSGALGIMGHGRKKREIGQVRLAFQRSRLS